MILNQKNSILNASSDIIFYCEDDIIVNKIPKIETINKLFNETLINNKPVGYISYNNHVYFNFNENPEHIIKFINDINNYVEIDGDVFLIKNIIIRGINY